MRLEPEDQLELYLKYSKKTLDTLIQLTEKAVGYGLLQAQNASNYLNSFQLSLNSIHPNLQKFATVFNDYKNDITQNLSKLSSNIQNSFIKDLNKIENLVNSCINMIKNNTDLFKGQNIESPTVEDDLDIDFS